MPGPYHCKGPDGKAIVRDMMHHLVGPATYVGRGSRNYLIPAILCGAHTQVDKLPDGHTILSPFYDLEEMKTAWEAIDPNERCRVCEDVIAQENPGAILFQDDEQIEYCWHELTLFRADMAGARWSVSTPDHEVLDVAEELVDLRNQVKTLTAFIYNMVEGMGEAKLYRQTLQTENTGEVYVNWEDDILLRILPPDPGIKNNLPRILNHPRGRIRLSLDDQGWLSFNAHVPPENDGSPRTWWDRLIRD